MGAITDQNVRIIPQIGSYPKTINLVFLKLWNQDIPKGSIKYGLACELMLDRYWGVNALIVIGWYWRVPRKKYMERGLMRTDHDKTKSKSCSTIKFVIKYCSK